MPVLFTPMAELQIGRLHAYIAARSNESRADGYIERIVSFCERLSPFPLRGTARGDLLPGLRTIGFERRVTIAFVVMEADVIVIEGVFYGGQDFEAAFLA